MQRSRNNGEDSYSRDVEVLATLLVAYPEVSRATFDPEQKALGMVFLCRGPMSAAARTKLTDIYKDSVEVYGLLNGRTANLVTTRWERMDRFYSFQIERDVATLSPGELNLTVDLVRQNAKIVPACEGLEDFDDGEEYTVPARLFLQEMLEQVRVMESPRKLVALREGERVLVFDK